MCGNFIKRGAGTSFQLVIALENNMKMNLWEEQAKTYKCLNKIYCNDNLILFMHVSWEKLKNQLDI